ncbi:protein lin-52 homolog isoform 5-T5 [Chlamydotis macqueenii]
MAELENDDIDMLKELGSLTTANLMEKVRGLQNLAYQLGLDEYMSGSPIVTGSWSLLGSPGFQSFFNAPQPSEQSHQSLLLMAVTTFCFTF